MVFVQYPYETLISLGQNLTHLSESLAESHRGAEDCEGLGSDQSEIQSAIESFRDTWRTSLLELENNIGQWGGLSQAIGQMVSDWDTQTAAALDPGE